MTVLVCPRGPPGRPYSDQRRCGLASGVHMSGLMSRRRAAALMMPAVLAVVALVVTMIRVPAGMLPTAAATLTVAQAISTQSGTGTVRGYVVGQPTATNTVLFADFTGDTAIAIADSSSETDPGD